MLLSTIVLGASFLAAPSPETVDTLSVGDRAPALSIEHFVKGERLDAFPSDRVTVVEFWATWCKPCIAGFPHLSELQEKYADDVIVVGVSDEPLKTVEPFLAKPKHGDVTRYRMATDPDRSMQSDWMEAAKQRGIPCAFIVDREGVIQFIGHPMSMDRALERVVTGKEPEPSEAAPLPEMSEEMFAVEGTHSPAAVELVDMVRARLFAPDGVVSFEQEILMRGALRMGGPDAEAMDLRKTRSGDLFLGGERGDRVEAKREMHIPGMPGGMAEGETLICGEESVLLKANGSSFMPSALPSGKWTSITRKDADELWREMPMPLPLLALMDNNPLFGNPRDMFAKLIEMSALDVALDEDGQVILEGAVAEMASVPEMSAPAEGEMRGNTAPSTMRIAFFRGGSGPVHVTLGDPEAPSFTMVLERTDRELGDVAFDIGDEEPRDLLSILREQQAQMRSMAPGSMK